MAGKVNQAETAYEEFEPLCKWHRNEERDILEVHLQEFKKEQLKVQISNHGILKISGERPLGASTTNTKFYKEVPVPSYKYDAQAIHAKFVNGCLCITMPKRKTLVPEIDEKTSSKIDRTPKPEPPKDQSTGTPPPEDISGGAKEQRPTPGGNGSTEYEFHGRKRPTSGLRLAKVAVTLAATAAAVAVLVAYVVYMYKSTIAEVDD